MLQREIATDTELVRRIRKGDHAAFRTIVERYEPQVAATAIGMLGPGPEAEDVGQNAFVRFYQAIDRFRGEASVGTYLTRIAINLSLNALKQRKRNERRHVRTDEAENGLPGIDGAQGVEERERDRVVRRAIDQLPDNQRSVVVLRMLQGYSTKETAELLRVPQGTVLSRLARAQLRLKEVLSPYMRNGAL